MIENTVQFYVRQRNNIFINKGYEWEFNARIGSHGAEWTICTFDEEPTQDQIKKTKDRIMRAFEFYHVNLKIPSFNMSEKE